MTVPSFLARLRLDSGADARAVRRAYARELKLIDQATEPAAFQQLRECYERALAWTEHVVREDAAAPAPCAAASAAPEASDPGEAASAQAPPRPTQSADAAASSDPAAQARLVLGEFCARLPALLALPGEVRLAPWTEALGRAAADRRLEHLEARVRFEALVAKLLADGWRPGHELLFPAASKVFGWEADRLALARLRKDGLVLDAALDEQAVFMAQDIQTRTRQREVLALLRKPEPPPEPTMRKLAGRVRTLSAQFPHLLGIVASRGAAEHWLARCPETVAGPGAPDQPTLRTPRAAATWLGWILMMLTSYWLTVGDHAGPHKTLPKFDPGIARILSQARHHPRPAPPALRPPSRLEREAIRARILYLPTPGTPAGLQEYRVEIYLDDDGNMVGVRRIRMPGDPAFGAAVEQAVHDSGPYPPETDRVFIVTFKAKVEQRRGRPIQVQDGDLT